MKCITILTCIHNNSVFIQNENYLPIHVGKALSDLDLHIQGDDSGDNISKKNDRYCELTALYWAWKNLKDTELIGLCHYRRYFDFHNQCKSWVPYTSFHISKYKELNISIPQNIINRIYKGEVVVPKEINFPLSNYNQYCTCHISDDIRTLGTIIKEKCERKYYDSYYNMMYNSHKIKPFNMFIMKWDMFDKYCTWLFDILNEFERRNNTMHYNGYQKRIYGFLSERLLNIFLDAEKTRYIQSPIILLEENPNIERGFFREKIRNFINHISFTCDKISNFKL